MFLNFTLCKIGYFMLKKKNSTQLSYVLGRKCTGFFYPTQVKLKYHISVLLPPFITEWDRIRDSGRRLICCLFPFL